MTNQSQAKEMAEKIFKGGDNFYAISQGKFWKIGFTNDYPLQHGDGKSYLIPDAVIEYLIKIKSEFNTAIQNKIKEVKEDGDGSVLHSAYWKMCGLHDSVNILNKVI